MLLSQTRNLIGIFINWRRQWQDCLKLPLVDSLRASWLSFILFNLKKKSLFHQGNILKLLEMLIAFMNCVHVKYRSMHLWLIRTFYFIYGKWLVSGWSSDHGGRHPTQEPKSQDDLSGVCKLSFKTPSTSPSYSLFDRMEQTDLNNLTEYSTNWTEPFCFYTQDSRRYH